MNSSHFCITKDGSYDGNADTCYWGLPSIQVRERGCAFFPFVHSFVTGTPVMGTSTRVVLLRRHVPSLTTISTAGMCTVQLAHRNHSRTVGEYPCTNRQASDPAYPPLGYWRGYIW
jgi:hypothetical protein